MFLAAEWDEPSEQPPVAVLQAIAAAGGLLDYADYSSKAHTGKPFHPARKIVAPLLSAARDESKNCPFGGSPIARSTFPASKSL